MSGEKGILLSVLVRTNIRKKTRTSSLESRGRVDTAIVVGTVGT